MKINLTPAGIRPVLLDDPPFFSFNTKIDKVVVAPISGRISQRRAEPGEMGSPGALVDLRVVVEGQFMLDEGKAIQIMNGGRQCFCPMPPSVAR